MRLVTVAGAIALIVAIAASASIYLIPHPTQSVTPSTPGTPITYSPTPGEIITYGEAGEVSPDEAREILLGQRQAGLPIIPAAKVGYLGEPGEVPITATVPLASVEEGLEYTQTNVQVPGIDEGDILKLAPPYGLYLTRATLYLLRLWPAENLSTVDVSSLSSIVYDAISSGVIEANASEYGVSIGDGQLLVTGNIAVAAFNYQLIPSGPQYTCVDNETVEVIVAGKEFTFVFPRCYPAPGSWGTAVGIYRFNETGLHLVGYHILSGLRLVETRLSNGTVYVFTVPYMWVPTGEERIDGVSVLEAGPTYVISSSELGNTLITVAAIRPDTGEVGVTNVILPVGVMTGSVIVYMRGDTAYLVVRDLTPPLKAEDVAEAMKACAYKAPDGLRQRLESLPPDASPSEFLQAIKEWGRDVEEELTPIIEWIHDITGGVIVSSPTGPEWGEGVTMPDEVRDLLSKLNEKLKAVGSFSDCVGAVMGNVSASSTIIAKVVFSGLKGAVTASAEVPGTVYDRFAIHEDGDYLYVVTTEEVGRAYLVPQPMPIAVVGAPYVGGESGTPMWFLIAGLFWGIEGLNYLEGADDLTDLVAVTPLWGWRAGSSLYVLRASDLTQVSSLRGIAPGERVYAARYVGDYLYLVTYRQVDPLFGIDVSDPANPVVLGWLEMPGYSEYLHPWGDRYLIGVGVGESWGLKVDLYDVSDPSNITRVSSVELGGWSEAFWEHHAFQPIDNETFAIPVMFSEGGTGIAVFRVTPEEGLTYLGTISVWNPKRSARIGDVIYAFGYSSVVAATFPGLEVISQIQLFGESPPPYVTTVTMTVTVVETTAPG